MNELLIKYSQLKAEKKSLGKELRSALMEDPEFAGFSEEVKTASEVMRARKESLIKDTPALGAIWKKIVDKKSELKIARSAITDSIMVVDKVSKEQVVMDLRF